jgi:hypothetical protein
MDQKCPWIDLWHATEASLKQDLGGFAITAMKNLFHHRVISSVVTSQIALTYVEPLN